MITPKLNVSQYEYDYLSWTECVVCVMSVRPTQDDAESPPPGVVLAG